MWRDTCLGLFFNLCITTFFYLIKCLYVQPSADIKHAFVKIKGPAAKRKFAAGLFERSELVILGY